MVCIRREFSWNWQFSGISLTRGGLRWLLLFDYLILFSGCSGLWVGDFVGFWDLLGLGGFVDFGGPEWKMGFWVGMVWGFRGLVVLGGIFFSVVGLF